MRPEVVSNVKNLGLSKSNKPKFDFGSPGDVTIDDGTGQDKYDQYARGQ